MLPTKKKNNFLSQHKILKIMPTKFSIQNLLHEDKEGKIKGAMSPALFAKEMSEQTGIKYNLLGRVWFDDSETFQRYEKGEGLTGYDCLIIADQTPDDLLVTIWVDMGANGIPVALAYKSEGGEISLTPIYERSKFARKLSKEELAEIITYIFEHPQELEITKEA